MIKGKFLLTAALAFLLFSCGEDDEPQGNNGAEVKLTAGFVPMQGLAVNTRLTTNDNWAGLADRTVAIEIDGTVKPYTVDERGNLTSQTPFYWGNKTELTVNAWYPYNGGTKPGVPVVKADQRGSGYWESDHLEVVNMNVPLSAAGIAFSHRNTKLVCHLTSTLPDVKGNNLTIRYLNLQYVEEGSTVCATPKGNALIAPQTVAAGTEFMEVTLPDERSYTYVLEEDLSLTPGVVIIVELELSGSGMGVTFKHSSSWDMNEEDLNGDTIENRPDVDTDNSWNNGGSDTMNGNTTGTEPNADGNGASWSQQEDEWNGQTANPA